MIELNWRNQYLLISLPRAFCLHAESAMVYLKNGMLQKIQSGITSPKIARILFYPTLLWNIITVGISRKRKWCNRIDRNVVLGALPLRIMTTSVSSFI